MSTQQLLLNPRRHLCFFLCLLSLVRRAFVICHLMKNGNGRWFLRDGLLGQKIACWTSYFSHCLDKITNKNNLGRLALAHSVRVWSIIMEKAWTVLAAGGGAWAAGHVSAIRKQRVTTSGALLASALFVKTIQYFDNSRISCNAFQSYSFLVLPPIHSLFPTLSTHAPRKHYLTATVLVFLFLKPTLLDGATHIKGGSPFFG